MVRQRFDSTSAAALMSAPWDAAEVLTCHTYTQHTPRKGGQMLVPRTEEERKTGQIIWPKPTPSAVTEKRLYQKDTVRGRKNIAKGKSVPPARHARKRRLGALCVREGAEPAPLSASCCPCPASALAAASSPSAFGLARHASPRPRTSPAEPSRRRDAPPTPRQAPNSAWCPCGT